jgi:hypothetical protein
MELFDPRGVPVPLTTGCCSPTGATTRLFCGSNNRSIEEERSVAPRSMGRENSDRQSSLLVVGGSDAVALATAPAGRPGRGERTDRSLRR